MSNQIQHFFSLNIYHFFMVKTWERPFYSSFWECRGSLSVVTCCEKPSGMVCSCCSLALTCVHSSLFPRPLVLSMRLSCFRFYTWVDQVVEGSHIWTSEVTSFLKSALIEPSHCLMKRHVFSPSSCFDVVIVVFVYFCCHHLNFLSLKSVCFLKKPVLMVWLLSLAVNESSCNFKKFCSVFRVIFFPFVKVHTCLRHLKSLKWWGSWPMTFWSFQSHILSNSKSWLSGQNP